MVELKKISALIVDDELNAINNLKFALNEHCPQVSVIGEAQTVKQAVEILAFQEIEVLFLDIRLRNETGFDLLKKIANYSGSIIFVTAHDEYGIQAIKFSATDYLLKPIDNQELVSAIKKVSFKRKDRDREIQIDMLIQSFQQTKGHGQKRITLPEASQIHYVPIDHIILCRSTNSYTTFFVKGIGIITVSKPINEYDSLLSPYGFVRTHQSFLINKNFIVSYKREDGGYLLMEGGHQALLSRQRKHLLKELLI